MSFIGRCFLAFVVAGAGVFALSPAGAATPAGAPLAGNGPTLASHKAVYAVTMTSVRPGGAYVDISGKMLLEFTDACDVWTTNQKSLLKTVSADGNEERSESYFSAVESKAGDKYTFQVKQTQDGETAEFRGQARRTGPDGAGVVQYTKPGKRTIKLPAHFFFQTAQQLKLIEVAQKGERFANGQMFDGTEGGGAAQFNAIILKGLSGSSSPLKSPLLTPPAHRVRVAFYPPSNLPPSPDSEGGQTASDTGEEPEYEMTMTLHDNGVVSDYDYDYADFSIHGRLEAIETINRPKC